MSALATTILVAGSLGAQPEFNFAFEMEPEFWTDEAMEEPWLLEEGDAGAKLLMLGKRSFL